MKFSKEKPPNWNEICKHFPVEWEKGVIVTYGDTIHCATDIGPQKEAHEAVHVEAQLKKGVEDWWKEYFNNQAFRLGQEVKAYIEETKWIRQNIKDRNKRYFLIRQIAYDLASPMYGNIITNQQAYDLLSHYNQS